MAEEAEKVLAAARDGDIKTLQSVRRSVPFATDSFGATALHHATRYGKLDCVRWMVEKVGMKAKVKAKNGATPLHDACTQGKLLCVKFFIQECKMNPDVPDNSGHTPLHLAARFGYVDIVKWMITKAKCNPRLKTMNRMNAVHFAAAGGHLNCLEFLIASGNTILLDERATDGAAPVFLAAQNGHFPCLQYLHTVGAKCELRSRDGMHLIHAAAQNGNLDCIGYLVINGLASETEGDSTGATPAHYAAGEGHVSVLKWLNKRSDLNIKDQLGGSPLHDASEKGQLAAVQYLVENGHLNTKLKDNSGLTPIELAEKYGHKRCHEYLKKASLKANQMRAAKLMSYSHTFDKQAVEDNSGSSFLHVLKKKPRQMDRPPSPKSSKAPDLPPLDVSPEVSPRTTPIPCMIEFGKASEWQIKDEDVEKEFPHTVEVDRSIEDHQVSQQEHLLDTSGSKTLSPLNEEFWESKNRNATPTLQVDAYTNNVEGARRFDDRPDEELTNDMLEAAKARTEIMNARMQNPTPSPLPIFDGRMEEIEAGKLDEFSTKIEATRAKRSPHITMNKNDYQVLKPVEIENGKLENENVEEKDESPMECNDSRSAESLPKPVVDPNAPKTLKDIFANADPSPEPKPSPPQSRKPSKAKSPTPPPKIDDKPPTPTPQTTETPSAPPPPPVMTPTPPPQKKEEPPKTSQQPAKQEEPTHRHPLRKNSHLYAATPLVPLSKSSPKPDTNSSPEPDTKPDSPKPSPAEDNTAQEKPKKEHETDENEQPIDEENYMTTDDETEKTASLPRPQKTIDESTPLRQRQLQPLPHMNGTAPPQIGPEGIDQDTWATLPEWKRQVLRNRIMKEQKAELQLRKHEEEQRRKFAGIPPWKVPIVQREESDRRNQEESLAHLPEWKRQLILRKRAKLMA